MELSEAAKSCKPFGWLEVKAGHKQKADMRLLVGDEDGAPQEASRNWGH